MHSEKWKGSTWLATSVGYLTKCCPNALSTSLGHIPRVRICWGLSLHLRANTPLRSAWQQGCCSRGRCCSLLFPLSLQKPQVMSHISYVKSSVCRDRASSAFWYRIFYQLFECLQQGCVHARHIGTGLYSYWCLPRHWRLFSRPKPAEGTRKAFADWNQALSFSLSLFSHSELNYGPICLLGRGMSLYPP